MKFRPFVLVFLVLALQGSSCEEDPPSVESPQAVAPPLSSLFIYNTAIDSNGTTITHLEARTLEENGLTVAGRTGVHRFKVEDEALLRRNVYVHYTNDNVYELDSVEQPPLWRLLYSRKKTTAFTEAIDYEGRTASQHVDFSWSGSTTKLISDITLTSQDCQTKRTITTTGTSDTSTSTISFAHELGMPVEVTETRVIVQAAKRKRIVRTRSLRRFDL